MYYSFPTRDRWPKGDEMRNYELTLILKANSENRDALVERLENALTESNTKIVKKDEKGVLEYAYEINHEFQGEYVYYELTTENSEFSKEFERVCKISDNVVRYLFVKTA